MWTLEPPMGPCTEMSIHGRDEFMSLRSLSMYDDSVLTHDAKSRRTPVPRIEGKQDAIFLA